MGVNSGDQDACDSGNHRAATRREGWQANIGFAGDPRVVEYQIDFRWQGSAIVVSSIRSEGDFGGWPLDLPADTQLQVFGEPPDPRAYDTAMWPVLTAGV